MNWGERLYLLLLWLIPIALAFLLWGRWRAQRALQLMISAAMAARMVQGAARWRWKMSAALLLLGLTVLILALARPQWGTRLETVTRRGIDVVLAVDSSLSMESADVAPTRLERAKYLMKGLIDRLGENRVGVVSFAGTAYLQCPLTLDHAAARMFLDIMDSRTVPTAGTDLGAAIRAALAALPRQEKKYKVLVLLTDGEDHEGSVDPALEEARQAGLIIHCLGIGTPAGQPIPVLDESGNAAGFKKDSAGSVVVSRLDEATLSRIAESTGGKYFFTGSGQMGIEGLIAEISGMDKKELESRMVRNFEDRFPWFLGLALFLLAAETVLRSRRGL